MGLQHYTLANFRKSTKEAFDNAEDGHPTFITRHNKRYELRLAPIQGYKAQDEALQAARAAAEHNPDKFQSDARAKLEGINTPQKTNIVEQFADKAAESWGKMRDKGVVEMVNAIAGIDYPLPAEERTKDWETVTPIVYPGVENAGMNEKGHIVKIDPTKPFRHAPGARSFDPDPMSVFDEPLPEKNFASDADASESVQQPTADYVLTWNYAMIDQWQTSVVHKAREIMQKALDAIDIDTQDPDDIERGTELAARIGDIDAELAKRGVK